MTAGTYISWQPAQQKHYTENSVGLRVISSQIFKSENAVICEKSVFVRHFTSLLNGEGVESKFQLLISIRWWFMPTLVNVGSSKIADEINFLAFLHCHISGFMTPRPVKFSVWYLHYAGCQEMWALPHYLIYFKCTGCLKMGKITVGSTFYVLILTEVLMWQMICSLLPTVQQV